jgi:hypothetical protein
VIDYIEQREVLGAQALLDKQIFQSISMQLPRIIKSSKEPHKKKHPVETATEFSHCIMPPQPESYIKCPQHDFL